MQRMQVVGIPKLGSTGSGDSPQLCMFVEHGAW